MLAATLTEEQRARLERLLRVTAGRRVTDLERLRMAPSSAPRWPTLSAVNQLGRSLHHFYQRDRTTALRTGGGSLNPRSAAPISPPWRRRALLNVGSPPYSYVPIELTRFSPLSLRAEPHAEAVV